MTINYTFCETSRLDFKTSVDLYEINIIKFIISFYENNSDNIKESDKLIYNWATSRSHHNGIIKKDSYTVYKDFILENDKIKVNYWINDDIELFKQYLNSKMLILNS